MSDFSEVLAADSLAKHFPMPGGGLPLAVLRGVNLTLRAAETVAICGASGCGKSTLLNLLAGLEAPSQGHIRWQGRNIAGLSRSQLATWRGQHLGFVFQQFYLLPELSVVENVLLAKRILGPLEAHDHTRAAELLEAVGLTARARYVPTKLSGGERQRVALVRALMNAPKLILADEPTGNLDEATGAEVMALLLSLAAQTQTALLLVTHNPDFAARCGRTLRLSDGELAAS